jgi:putative transposase
LQSNPRGGKRSAARLDEALLRSEKLKLLAATPRLTTLKIDEVAKDLGIGRAYVYRLLAAFRKRPRTSTLIPKTRGRKAGTRLVRPQIELIVEKAIESFYLQRIKPPFSALLRQIQADCHGAGLKPPDRKTIGRRIAALDERKTTAAREGAKTARERYDRVSRSPAIKEALEKVQIDHTPVDLIVADELKRQPLGRPWLSLVIDIASRMVCGFFLSMIPPSSISVALALAHCVARKDLWLADRELNFDWPVSGLPDLVYMDNAKEFHAEALRSAAQEWGINLEFRPRGLPHFGGHIERLIGTMMGAVHLIPGTTFSNVAERGDYPSAKNAVMTLPEFERWFALQVHVYHSTIHSSLNVTPLTAWKQAVAVRDIPISQMTDADQRNFFLDLLPGERRKIRRDGIRLFNIHYWNNVLSPFAGRIGAPVLVKYDPRDLSTIHYQDEQGNYWAIPYRDLGAPPISLWEQRAAESALRALGKHSFNENDVFSTVLQQRDIVDAARDKTRKIARPESRQHTPVPAIHLAEEDDLAQAKLPAFKVEEWD